MPETDDQWVLDALLLQQSGECHPFIGMSGETSVDLSKPTYFLSRKGRMLANIVAGSTQALNQPSGTRVFRYPGHLTTEMSIAGSKSKRNQRTFTWDYPAR